MRLGTPWLVSPSAAPVLLSTDAPWQDILVVEQHRLAAQHWHESAARPYLVGMALSPPGQLEWRTADGDQDRTCEPPAGRCFFTANSPIVWRQAQEADVIVAALNPVFVDRVAEALSVLGLKKLGPMSFTDIGVESILSRIADRALRRLPERPALWRKPGHSSRGPLGLAARATDQRQPGRRLTISSAAASSRLHRSQSGRRYEPSPVG